MNDPVAFDNEESMDRVLRATRYVERIIGSPDGLNSPLPPANAGVVIISVTGDPYTEDPDPVPFDDYISVVGLYPGLFYYRNPESVGSDDTWYTLNEPCYVEDPNEGQLESNKRYIGTVIGVRNGLAVVEVVGAIGSGADSTCIGCGWITGLTATDCIKFTILDETGRCDCGDAGQTVYANSGANVSDLCCSSVPVVLDVVFSNATGDCADFFTDPAVISHTENNSGWSGFVNTAQLNLSCSDLQWVALLFFSGDDFSTVITGTPVSSTCGPFGAVFDFIFTGIPCTGTIRMTISPHPIDDESLLIWTGILTVCDVDYVFSFIPGEGCDPLCLTLTSVGGSYSDTTYVAKLDCCGCNYAIFAIGVPEVCTGDPDAIAGPCGNLMRVKAEWTCCPMMGWKGPGWYCVTDDEGGPIDDPDDPGGGGEGLMAVTPGDPGCTVVELGEADKCRTDILIASGPYSSELIAKARTGDFESGVDCGSGPPYTPTDTVCGGGIFPMTGPGGVVFPACFSYTVKENTKYRITFAGFIDAFLLDADTEALIKVGIITGATDYLIDQFGIFSGYIENTKCYEYTTGPGVTVIPVFIDLGDLGVGAFPPGAGTRFDIACVVKVEEGSCP